MKKFILSEILLISHQEKKAKKVIFDPWRTLIYGKNGMGKSSLIKSIYKTFGAAPFKDHPLWMDLNPISLVKFTVDGIAYSILKNGKVYAIFDSDDLLIEAFNDVTKGLGPFLANLFDFKIQLPDQSGKSITPPPAYLFLPYYIDQDTSWQSNWSGFAKLTQIRGYREPMISYHTGIKPNEYYETKIEIEEHKNAISTMESENNVLKDVLKKIQEKLSHVDFNIDIDLFKQEIEDLLKECERLKTYQNVLRTKLIELYNWKLSVESQLDITTHALNESRKDYKYATQVLIDNGVECPTCGAHYENSFADRFEIAKDEDRCKELLIELTAELSVIDERINRENNSYNKYNEEVKRVEALLETKKGEVKLKDVIENAGRNEVRVVFEENSSLLTQQIYEQHQLKIDLEKKLKALVNKDRKKEILDMYNRLMRNFLTQIDVKTLSEDSYKKIESTIPETGSALPRALIAYYFSIFHVMKKYTTSAFCPMIIDSPNQQAQDHGHIDQILEFVNKNQPTDTQMILGIEELYDVDFNCPIVELTNHRSLLREDEFAQVNSEIDHFLTEVWNKTKTNRLFR